MRFERVKRENKKKIVRAYRITVIHCINRSFQILTTAMILLHTRLIFLDNYLTGSKNNLTFSPKIKIFHVTHIHLVYFLR